MGEVVGWSLVPWSPEQTASVLAHAITTSGAVVTASSSQAVYGSLTTTTSSLGPQVEAGPGVEVFHQRTSPTTQNEPPLVREARRAV